MIGNYGKIICREEEKEGGSMKPSETRLQRMKNCVFEVETKKGKTQNDEGHVSSIMFDFVLCY